MKKIDPKTKKVLIGLVVVIIIIVIFNKARAQSEQSAIAGNSAPDGSPVSPSSTSSGSSVPAWKRKYDALPSVGSSATLKKGSKSKEVWQLQNLFNDNIATSEKQTKLVVDGVFGSNTEKAVKYVTGGRYSYMQLSFWQQLVKMSQLERNHYFLYEQGSTTGQSINVLNW